MRPSAFARVSLVGGLLLTGAMVVPDLGASPERRAIAAPSPEGGAIAAPGPASADRLYDELRLDGILDREAFAAAHERVAREGVGAPALAIADMRKPSTEQRFVILDLERRRVVLQTWVAHGAGSGGLMAERFSNRNGSHQTSLGLYRVGERIRSPKHGAALLLEGLDPGVNDLARVREVIIHGADYVSEAFIASTGRLGRSWGCPAVPRDQMSSVVEALADGGYLYVHGA